MADLQATPVDVVGAGVAPDGGKYVYCIIRSDRQREFGAIGIGGRQRVYTVAFHDLAAVVSDTPIVIYDPTRERRDQPPHRVVDVLRTHATRTTDRLGARGDWPSLRERHPRSDQAGGGRKPKQ